MTEARTAQLYMIRQEACDSADAKQVGSADLERDYTAMAPLQVGGRPHVLGYAPEPGDLDVYSIRSQAPHIEKTDLRLHVGPGYDMIEPFVIGNQPHLVCYAAKAGAFDLFSVGEGFSLSGPYRYAYTRGPAATAGFTTAKPFVSSGEVGVMGYSADDGHVAIYKISVVASSPPNVPPLKMTHAWAHQWARGWTRFAFFDLGGAIFFLKTNVVTPNVNIDRVLDGMVGAVRVGTRLDLPGALRLTDVQPFDLEGGDPWFVTYEKTGTTTLNRIHGDCQGWTRACSFNAARGAERAIPLRLEGEAALFIA